MHIPVSFSIVDFWNWLFHPISGIALWNVSDKDSERNRDGWRKSILISKFVYAEYISHNHQEKPSFKIMIKLRKCSFLTKFQLVKIQAFQNSYKYFCKSSHSLKRTWKNLTTRTCHPSQQSQQCFSGGQMQQYTVYLHATGTEPLTILSGNIWARRLKNESHFHWLISYVKVNHSLLQ